MSGDKTRKAATEPSSPTTCSALNNWLEEQALGWEKQIEENPHLSGATWPEYYRSLKDLDQQTQFTISSCDFVGSFYNEPHSNLLISYLDSHTHEYECEGFTGYAVFTRKDSLQNDPILPPNEKS